MKRTLTTWGWLSPLHKTNYSFTPPGPGNLTWPTTSRKISLGYGEIDNIDRGRHVGIDVQGNEGDNIVSAINGTVVYNGFQSGYGNVVYVNGIYNGKQIQTRYAHLQDNSIQVSTGSSVNAGIVIGRMGFTGNTYGGAVLHFEVLESTDGNSCRNDGINTVRKSPLSYFSDVNNGEVSFLGRPTATGKVPGDTFANGTLASYSLSSTVSESVYSSVYATGLTTMAFEIFSKDQRYRWNWDLETGKGYLRKLISDNTGIDSEQLEANGFLHWSSAEGGIAIVTLNGKPAKEFSIRLGNAIINRNERLMVDLEEFYNYFYLDTIENNFIAEYTYKDYKFQSVDTLLGLLKNGFSSAMWGAKSPWDTPGLRNYYVKKEWPARLAEMNQDPTFSLPDDISGIVTLISNNYYMWMENQGLVRPEDMQARVNWDNGTYVVQAAAAYLGVIFTVELIGLTAIEIGIFKEAVALCGWRYALYAFRYGGMQYVTWLRDINQKATQMVDADVIIMTEALTAEGEILNTPQQTLFRGTTVGYVGNPSVQAVKCTPSSSDPLVATCFATEAEKYGDGIVYIATKNDLAGVVIGEGNWFQELEAEVVTKITPIEFMNRSSMSITSAQARNIFRNMGFDVPSYIANPTELRNLLYAMLKLNSQQIEEFINAAIQLVRGN